ncbi:MAG: hypothetical protein WD576_01860, partial [Nitriliruptoraceae bacterium]
MSLTSGSRRDVRRNAWLPGQRLINAPARSISASNGPTVGVLALQGDVYEHVTALERVGAATIIVKHPQELSRVDGIVLPGGESTT